MICSRTVFVRMLRVMLSATNHAAIARPTTTTRAMIHGSARRRRFGDTGIASGSGTVGCVAPLTSVTSVRGR
jgi:hypothetical protein